MVGFSSEKWFTESGFYPYEIGQSCRFSEDNSESFSRAPSSAGDKKTYTMSLWVKRTDITSSALFSSGTSGTELTQLSIQGDGNLRFRDRSDDNLRKDTTALLRDLGAWYHIVCAVDVTQASNSNRVKIYINGTLQTAFDIDDTFSNRNTYINRTGGNGMVIGRRAYDTGSHFDGYMAEVHFIDGTQVTADSFGETKEGVWIPKAYTGSYGTNGFYLKFDQTGTGTASASTIGADSSGNNNHLTSTNLSANDSNIPDSPTNNFCTMNPLALSNTGSADFKIGNTKITLADNEEAFGTVGVSSGKWYFELDHQSSASSNNKIAVGIADADAPNNNEQVNYGHQATTWGVGDIISVAVDVDNETITFRKNNVAIETDTDWSSKGWTTIVPILTSGNSAGDETGMLNFGGDSSFNTNQTAQGNSDENGHGDFYYTPPSGYLALCSANLPEPTISPLNGKQPSDYFNTALYNGDSSGHTVTGVGFQSSFTWIKSRTLSESHQIYDSFRGAFKSVRPNESGAESTFSSKGLSSWNSDGFVLTDGNNRVTDDGDTYVSWNWRGNDGASAASNSDGSTASEVIVNTEAGFSIVSYTGTGSTTTIGHGLGKKPSTMWIKNRDSSMNWTNYFDTTAMGATKVLFFDLNNVLGDSTTPFNDTEPTTSVFTVGSSGGTNASSDKYIAYCFTNIEGYSKVGQYSGNNDADGPFIYTGFRPAWLIIKRTDDTKNWHLTDNKRDTHNRSITRLFPNLSDDENAASGYAIDLVSNGIKIRNTDTDTNASGGTYIYTAFAEMPFKYANAR